MIKVAVPNKGMLCEPTIDLLKACGYKASKATKSLSSLDLKSGIEFYFLRPSDIPMYVGKGIIDAGITGIDFCAEASSPAVKILDLPFGASKHCAAVPIESECKSLEDLRNLRIATSFPGIVKSFFKNPNMELVVLEGAVEISVGLGIADAVVDVVETGTTLKQAGLRVLGEALFKSNAALFANPEHKSSPEIATIVRRLEGKLLALEYKMIEYDVPASLLDKACAITPGIESPTVAPLQNKSWYSVKAMVKSEEANPIMDSLLKLGCKGILLFSIESARI
ncbi:MAG: ATP phosphoribosyltransferase [Fibromonadaceae bacterium]|jgi:ATP phosphoribosyltransferase|nr:ATP phosphoribosyltransferase [Fibromonadaceae bacterium]